MLISTLTTLFLVLLTVTQDPPKPACPNKQISIEPGTLALATTFECDDGLTSFTFQGIVVEWEDETCVTLLWTPPIHTIVDGTGLTFAFDEIAHSMLLDFICDENDLCVRNAAGDTELSGSFPQYHTLPCE